MSCIETLARIDGKSRAASSRLSIILMVAVTSCITFSTHIFTAVAEGQISECSSVKVFVRTIKASEPLEEGRNVEEGTQSVAIDSQLQDLTARLEKLPFRSFTLLASREEMLTLRKKETLSLPNGQTLTFRPIYVDNRRVGMSLDWRDRGGTGILNTRVHFDPNESLLTGADAVGEFDTKDGLILAIRAVPIHPEHPEPIAAVASQMKATP